MTVKQIVPITNHVDRAIARLPIRYRDATKSYSLTGVTGQLNSWEVFLHAFVGPIQTFENICNSILSRRGILSSQGVNLDRLGNLVGVSRNGQDDVTYLSSIYTGIARNYSEGTAADIIGIWQRIFESEEYHLRENFPAKFELWLKNPPLDFQYSFVADVTNAAKAAGVGFLPIRVSQYKPIFAFESDPDPDTAGFGVLKTTNTPYAEYVFPPNGSIANSTRMQMSASTSGPNTDYLFSLVLDSTQGPLFEAELIAAMSTPGSKVKFRDAVGHWFEFTTDGTATVSNFIVLDYHEVTLQFVTSNVPNGLIQYGGVAVTPDYLLTVFQSYGQTQDLDFAANNPDGIIESYTYDFEVSTLTYYTDYTFAANYPGGALTRVISSKRFGFPSRYFLSVITPLGAPATAFSAQIAKEGQMFSVFDKNNVHWQYFGSLTFTEANLIDLAEPLAREFDFELATDGLGNPLGTLYKDGVETDYDDFFFNFAIIRKNEEAIYNANNPNGLGNIVSASNTIGGGFYSIIIV